MIPMNDSDESKLVPVKVLIVLIKTAQAQLLLLQCSCFRRDRKPIVRPQKLTAKEFKQLTEILHSDGFVALEKLLLRIEDEHQEKLAPVPYRSFSQKLQEICQLVEWYRLQDADKHMVY